ncbi:MAG: alkene reductase [Pseudomonadota bacterium]
MSNNVLFQPLTAGSLRLRNRVLMAPMTRSRADHDGNVGELTATYYAQRAGAGLIVTEGIFPAFTGKGYLRTPGLVNRQHVAAWKRVTDAVHARGGQIVAQIMHVGRISHASLLPAGEQPVAPSAVAAGGSSYTLDGPQPHPVPRELSRPEIAAITQSFADAAENAIAAGFDGVQLHAGNGYLGMQFLSPNSNRRRDDYGGSAENRARFVVETLEAMVARVGADRVSLKVTPGTGFNDMQDPDPEETYATLFRRIAHLPLAFVDVSPDDPQRASAGYHALLRPLWKGRYFAGRGLTPESASALVADGHADAVFFGSGFIANPDLPERVRRGAALATPDAATFYAGEDKGYTDYPALPAAQPA